MCERRWEEQMKWKEKGWEERMEWKEKECEGREISPVGGMQGDVESIARSPAAIDTILRSSLLPHCVSLRFPRCPGPTRQERMFSERLTSAEGRKGIYRGEPSRWCRSSAMLMIPTLRVPKYLAPLRFLFYGSESQRLAHQHSWGSRAIAIVYRCVRYPLLCYF